MKEKNKVREKILGILDSAPVAIIVIQDDKFVYVNQKSLTFSEYTREEIIGKHYTTFFKQIHPEDRNFIAKQIKTKQMSESKNEFINYQFRWFNNSGDMFWFDNYLTSIEFGGQPADLNIFTDITLRKKKEERLKYYEMIIEGSPDLIAGINKKYEYVFVNNTFLDYHQLNREEVVGHTAKEILGTNLFDSKIKSFLERCFQGETISYEMEKVYPERGKRHLEVKYQPIIEDGKKILFIVAIIRDITKQQETKQKLKNVEREFENLIESSPFGIVILNQEGEITNINEKFTEMFGYEREEVLGTKLFKLVGLNSEKTNFLKHRFSKYIEGKKLKPIQLKVKDKKGQDVYVAPRVSVISRDGERFLRISIRDITERKLSEEALKKSEKKYRKLVKKQKKLLFELETINKTLIKISNKKNIDTICQILAKLVLSLNEKAIVAVSFYDPQLNAIRVRKILGLGKNREKMIQMLQKYSATFSVKVSEMEKEKSLYTTGKIEEIPGGLYTISAGTVPKKVCKKAEKMFNIDKTYTIGFALEENPIGGIIIFLPKGTELQNSILIKSIARYSSLTMNRIQTEKELEKSRKQYEEAFKSVDFYKDLLAHDIANIINNIKMSVELAEIQSEEDGIPEKMQDFLKIMNSQLNRAVNLIKKIRTISKIETDKLKIKKLNVLKLLRKIIDSNVFLNQKSVSININAPAVDEDIYILAGDFLEDAFENILINAIQHNISKNPYIEVKVRKMKGIDKKRVQIDFIDNGIGIPKHMREKIFSRGYKVNQTSRGMGIGLSLVKKIIKAYRGKIWVESRVKGNPKKGSIFSIILPAPT
jgi:PAS domain S-box-containing protein